MFIVLARPFDDTEIVEVYAVESGHKGFNAFDKAWEKEKEYIKKQYPEDWDIAQVIKILEGQGWSIMRLNAGTVTY